MTSETIAAIATAAGVGGVGVIRVSGRDALRIVADVIGKNPDALPDRVLTYGVARGNEGRIDDVLAVAMRCPRSYTGEDVAELHGHGGAKNLGRLLRLVLEKGARSAEPGEFTRRAFANGKIDLTRAEAVIDVIEAGSDRALRLAQQQLAGELGAVVRQLRESATELMADVEARADFPEEGLEQELGTAGSLAERADALSSSSRRLAASFTAARAVRNGISVALVGAVNAGKSSLFNRLVGEERAIVTAEAGTTRDYVEARVEWDGVAVTLIDTAGQRAGGGSAASNAAERRGIELSERRAASVDLQLVVREAGEMFESEAQPNQLHVVSKADLMGPGDDEPEGSDPQVLATSAQTGQGVQGLKGAVVARCLAGAGDADEGAVVTSERQRALLNRAARGFAAAGDGFRASVPEEMVAVDLGDGLSALSEVLGERVGEEVLDALFARFCIGK